MCHIVKQFTVIQLQNFLYSQLGRPIGLILDQCTTNFLSQGTLSTIRCPGALSHRVADVIGAHLKCLERTFFGFFSSSKTIMRICSDNLREWLHNAGKSKIECVKWVRNPKLYCSFWMFVSWLSSRTEYIGFIIRDEQTIWSRNSIKIVNLIVEEKRISQLEQYTFVKQ